MEVILIAALDRGRVIGRGGALPWRLRSDLRRFRRLTLGHTLVMGRKTAESIGRALPGRRCLVLTRDVSWGLAGMERVGSVEEALEAARVGGASTLFVAGGEGVYAAFMSRADALYLTRVEASAAGDAFFPPWEGAGPWSAEVVERACAGEGDEVGSAFEVWRRCGAP